MHAFDRVDVLGKHYPPGFERGISARCVLVANRLVTDLVKAQVFLRTFAGYGLDDHRKRMIGLNAEQYVRDDMLGERAEPGTDFHDGVPFPDFSQIDDSCGNRRIRKEVLSETTARIKGFGRWGLGKVTLFRKGSFPSSRKARQNFQELV